MTRVLPFIRNERDKLSVQFLVTEAVRSAPVQCVADFTDLGEIIGVEILDLLRQTNGSRVLPSPTQGGIHWSYDEEIDAFYVRLGEGRGQVQKTLGGTAHLDRNGQLVQLDVPLPG